MEIEYNLTDDFDESFIDDRSVYIENISDLVVRTIESLMDDELDDGENDVMEIKDPNTMNKIQVGQIFVYKMVLQESMCLYAIRNDFQFKTEKSCNRQYWVVCINPDCTW